MPEAVPLSRFATAGLWVGEVPDGARPLEGGNLLKKCLREIPPNSAPGGRWDDLGYLWAALPTIVEIRAIIYLTK